MAGLLDFNDPTQAGLLAFAANMFNAGGPSRTPVGFGQAIASGLGGMQQAQQQAELLQKQKEMMDAQLQMEKLKELRAKTEFDNKQAFYKGLSGGGSSQGAGNSGSNGGSSLSNLSLDQLAQAAVLGISGAKELFELKKYADNGIERKTGTMYRSPITGKDEYIPDPTKGFSYDPQTQTVSTLAGFNQANAGMKGAETAAIEGAKAANDLITINSPNGPTMMTRQDAVRMAGGGQPQQAAYSGNDGLDLSKLSPQQIKFLQSQDPTAFANGITSFGQPAANLPQLPNANRTGVGIPLQSDVQKEQEIGAVKNRLGASADLNKNWITQSLNPVVEAGRSAKDILGSLDALKTIDLKTGWGTEAKATAANVLTSLGIAPENAKLFATNTQKFQSVAMSRLLDTLGAQKGPQTEGDAQRAQKTFAMLQNTPEANQFIADFARAKANLEVRRASFYQDALPIAQQTGDLNEIDRRWKKIQGSIWDDPILQPYMGGR